MDGACGFEGNLILHRHEVDIPYSSQRQGRRGYGGGASLAPRLLFVLNHSYCGIYNMYVECTVYCAYESKYP